MRWMIVFLIGTFLISNVFAISGVSPGSYEVDFDESLDREFLFTFIFDEDVSSEIYVSEKWEDYVTLSKSQISGSERVGARVVIDDSSLLSPGINKIRIGAREVLGEGVSGVGLASDVGGLIKIKVPYPGRYVFLELFSTDGNVDEEVNLSLKVSSMGNETVSVNSKIQIFYEENLIKQIDFGKTILRPEEYSFYTENFVTSGLEPGEYRISGLSEYADTYSQVDNRIRLGEYLVSLVEADSEIAEKELNEFEVILRNKYSMEIYGVFVEVNLKGENYRSVSSNLRGFEEKSYSVFIDPGEIEEDYVSGEIVFHYGDEVVREQISLEVLHKRDYLNLIYFLSIGVILLIVLWRVVIFFARIRKISRR